MSHSSFYDRESAEDRVRELAGHNPYLVHYREVLPGDIEIINENDLPELTPEEEQATKEIGEDFLAFIRWQKQLGDEQPAVYNGKTAKEWYERFGLLTQRHAKLVRTVNECLWAWEHGKSMLPFMVNLLECTDPFLGKEIDECVDERGEVSDE